MATLQQFQLQSPTVLLATIVNVLFVPIAAQLDALNVILVYYSKEPVQLAALSPTLILLLITHVKIAILPAMDVRDQVQAVVPNAASITTIPVAIVFQHALTEQLQSSLLRVVDVQAVASPAKLHQPTVFRVLPNH